MKPYENQKKHTKKHINKNTSDIFKPWNTPQKLTRHLPLFHGSTIFQPLPTIPMVVTAGRISVSLLHVETDASLPGSIGIGRHDLPATNLGS